MLLEAQTNLELSDALQGSVSLGRLLETLTKVVFKVY